LSTSLKSAIVLKETPQACLQAGMESSMAFEAVRSYKLFLKYWKGNKKYRHIVEGKIERLLDSKH